MTKSQMQQIVDQLNQMAYQYYVLDEPTVSDATYDALYDKLVELELTSGIVLPDSPTRRVGDKLLSGFSRHKHMGRLYSLDKVQSTEALAAWCDKITKQYPEANFSIELKYDGLAICLTYDNGYFVSAATRGNGLTGEDITQQALTIKSIPLSINDKSFLEIQGEAYMNLSSLNKFNQLNANDQLKNARNAAAGALRNLDINVTRSRNLNAVFYNINYGYVEGVNTQSSLINFLKNNNFRTDSNFKLALNSSQVLQFIDELTNIRQSFDFLIDGIVVKVNQFDIRENIGYTDKFPKWAVAFKFEAEEAITTVDSVSWNVGRSGKVTPIANLQSVELAGATIKRATLNNYGDILRKNVSIGSLVAIRRSNDVIPEVLRCVLETDNSIAITKPTNCPSCNSLLTENGAHLFCLNRRQCKEQIISRLINFASKSAMDIDGLSEMTIRLLVNNLGIYTFSQLYSLTYQQISQLEGFKDKKANNLINAINKSKDVSLAKLIAALGIDNVGSVTALDLASNFKSITALSQANIESLNGISNIGDVVAASIIEYFADEFNLSEVNRLISIGINPLYEEIGGIFNNMSFVITGTLDTLTRSQASKIIIDNGGKISDTVSKSTSVLIVGKEAGSKLEKATKLGIKLWSENDLLNAVKK